MTFYLTDLGLVNALGTNQEEVWRRVLAGERGLSPCDWIPGASTYTAGVSADLLALPGELRRFDSRNARLAVTALAQITPSVDAALSRYGAARIAVVAGTSTSGIAEGEAALRTFSETGQRPATYHYRQQEIGNLAEVIAHYYGLQGPAYTLSTACSSSAHALGSAARLLASGAADAVIAGGADSLCRLTVNGFAALESVDENPCVPFSRNRAGINIGEAAAFFLVTREPLKASIALLGVGASSDAHHISAPEPGGRGAEAAIRAALTQARLDAEAISYINLHGTGTRLNDAMESAVVERLFPAGIPCSSSKGQLGHTLGAAGATEAALCWLALSRYNPHHQLPPHVWDGEQDPDLKPLNLVKAGATFATGTRRLCLSNSFAFGGNNAAVIVGDPA
ncbi:beta-ketoacyl-[acyl-carrier-protein] synthase family protein [Marinimicrobium sp. ABcell2]|uniref:beta-ketoacyl-[acyl-carrier-protein] synthase family protein n=1 Tax=Marinimicrobium sp. ABcell2 TaxID=3069751 RepID=UPI0027ADDBBE|nr:beta-ketoacyl-[acyl-carrier-protein] synthase family protein [Marinimicrobium sp. ABcell2]MDQ2076964.1 beta-ketoacyl-[acyl-carrier-protein] synthase family protein [Marinimicrobium sp. ABcell2]